jgi:hypothetical protein
LFFPVHQIYSYYGYLVAIYSALSFLVPPSFPNALVAPVFHISVSPALAPCRFSYDALGSSNDENACAAWERLVTLQMAYEQFQPGSTAGGLVAPAAARGCRRN